MKKIILALALVTGLTTVSFAQNTKPGTNKENKANMSPEERAKKSAQRMEKELGLNADQKTKWEAATLERINANAPLHEKMKASTTPEDRKALHSQAKANNEKFDTAVNSFLTADQKAKWTQIKENRKKSHPQSKNNEIEEHD